MNRDGAEQGRGRLVATPRERDALQHAPVLRWLTTEQRMHLLRRAVRRVYTPGAVITSRDGAQDWLCLVTRGAVRISLLAPTGREMTLALRRRGELFGVSGDDAPEPAAVVAQALQEKTVIVWMAVETLLQTVRDAPEATRELVELLWERIVERQRLLGELVFCDVRVRLAHTLAVLAEGSEDGTVTATHDELARMVATTRPRVSAELAVLRDDHLITYESFDRDHRILVLDLTRLRSRS